MRQEKLEKLVQKPQGLFNSKGKKIDAIPIGDHVILRGPVVGLSDRSYPGSISIFENKPEEANAYCELDRWVSEWTADSSIQTIHVQYYKIVQREGS